MQRCVRGCSNRARSNACSNPSANRRCSMPSMKRFVQPERRPATDATPIVFVVDDDISVRESLELLIRCEGWQPELFASAQAFLAHSRVVAPSCLVLDVG